MVRRLPCAREVRRLITKVVACAVILLASNSRAGELGDIAEDVQSGGEFPSHGSDADYDSYNDPYDEDESIWDRLLAGAFEGASSLDRGLEYTAYPYENDHEGYLADLANPDAATHPLSKRLWAECGGDFDDIDLVSGGILVEGDHRLGFDITWRTYFEDLGAEGHDDLSTGDANALFRLWQSDTTALRLGGGASWLEFDGEWDAGYNFTVSGEFYPVRPINVAWEWDAGMIGHASLLHGRVTIGANLRHFEVYTGVDFLDIDDTDLTCMVTGIRSWW